MSYEFREYECRELGSIFLTTQKERTLVEPTWYTLLTAEKIKSRKAQVTNSAQKKAPNWFHKLLCDLEVLRLVKL